MEKILDSYSENLEAEILMKLKAEVEAKISNHPPPFSAPKYHEALRLLVTLQPFAAAPFPLLGNLKHCIQTFVHAGGICIIWFICCSFKFLQCWKCVRRIPQGGLARCCGRDVVITESQGTWTQ